MQNSKKMLYFYKLIEDSQEINKAMKQTFYHKLLSTLFVLFISSYSYASITAGFTVSYTPRCGSALVTFTNTSVGSPAITSAIWYWGDSPLTSTSTTASSVSHLFSSPGTYCVKLVVTNSAGQRDSFQLSPPNCIEVYANPTPIFTITPTYSCDLPAVFTVTNASIPGCGTFASTSIQPEGDTIYTSSSFTTTYTSAGNYNLTYYMRNSCGCAVSGTLVDTFHAVAGVDASFITSSTTSCTSPLVVTFTSTSSGTVTSTLWDTNNDYIYGGAGDAPSGVTTTRTYTTSGTYDVGLLVRNSSGCVDTIRIPVVISITPAPLTSFTYSTTPGCGVICVTCTADGGGSSFSWTVTPGSTSPATGTGSPFTFCAAAAGSYSVRLRTDFGGCTDDSTRTVTIGSITPPPVAVASATGCLESCIGPVCVTYNSIGSTPASGSGIPPAVYTWTFPSGTPSTAIGPGPHVICYGSISTTSLTAPLGTLLITTSPGCTNSRTLPGNVVIADYTNSIVRTGLTRGCLPIIDSFLDNTVVNACDSIASRSWTFGLGRTPVFTSILKKPGITFTDTGCYDVRLITVTGRGCRDTTLYPKMICAGDTPNISVSISPTDMCFEDTGVIITVTGRADSIKINWGDGFNNTLLKDTVIHSYAHIYTDTGFFVPIIRAFLYGCGERLIYGDTVYIHGPIARFTDSTVCPSVLTKSFINQSLGDSTMTAFWDFGVVGSSDDTSHVFNPTFTYPDTGCYTVTLTVHSDLTGCTHQKRSTFCISDVVTDFMLSSRDVCQGTVVSYINTSSSIRTGSSTRWVFMGTSSTVTTPWTGSTYGLTTRNSVANLSCLKYVIMQYIDGFGCSRELIKPNYLNIRVLTAKMGASLKVGCGPLTVCYYDSSSAVCDSIVRRRWDFGDSLSVSDTSSALNPCYTFTRTGDYNVTLTIWDSIGCSKTTAPRMVRVINPVADFNLDTLICLGNLVNVTSNASGYKPIYAWTFPGATSSTAANVRNLGSLTYSAPGLYTVTLTVTDSLGCDSVMSKQVRVYEPIANFGTDDTFFNCDGGVIRFYDSSYTNICSWDWDFGDGSIHSFLQNPTHFYLVPGLYSVKLIVRTCDGCTDTIIKPSYIFIKGPTGSFSFSPGVMCVGDSVTVTVNSMNTTEYYWLPGRGYSPPVHIVRSPAPPADSTITDIFRFAYYFPIAPARDTGRFEPELYLIDSAGCAVVVSPRIQLTVDSLWLKFGSFPSVVCDTGTVCFYDSSIYLVSRLQPTIYDWDYGDGSAHGTSANVCHKYTSPGTYRVRLYGYNSAAGCGDSIVRIVTIRRRPVANFMRSDSLQCIADVPIIFTDLSTGDTTISRWNWQFDRPGTSNSSLQNPTFDYLTAGTYSVKLTITDTLGCIDSTFKSILIVSNPIANAGRDTTICYGRSARLVGAGGKTYAWSPATFLSSTIISNPLSTPDSTTTYILTVTDTAGCTSFDTVTIFVSRVYAGFVNDTVCVGDSTYFTNTSVTNIGTLTSWTWNFADPPTSILNNPVHRFTTAGTYNVSLRTINSFGCLDDTIIPTLVLRLPIANFATNAPCVGDSTRFLDLSSSPSGGSIVSWRWNFGDLSTLADTSNSQNPSYYYTAAGTYSVHLTVSNAGCSKDTFISIRVYANPIANFRVDTSCAYGCNTFTNFSTAASSSIRLNSWIFDTSAVINNTLDTSTLLNPVYCYPIPPYTYPSPSYSHYAYLVVTDTNGCKDDTGMIAIVVALPTASFAGDTLCPGDTMNFISTSSVGLGVITSWSWNFGDTTITSDVSSLRNPTYRYTRSGTYRVQLTVTDRFGCTDDTFVNVIVNPNPIANFITDSACLGDSIYLLDSSSANFGVIASWNWNFTTPPVSTQRNPSYLYATAGLKLVTLTVANSAGCSDDTSINAYIFNNPVARFTIDSVCLGDSNHVLSNSLAGSFPITSYTWVFDPLDTARTSAESRLYATAGAHPVRLFVTDAFGCKDDTSNTNLFTFTLPVADFSFSGGCGSLPVNFNSSISVNGTGGSINAWNWYFDPGIGIIQNPSWSFGDLLSHQVQLVVSDVRGCFDTIVKPVGGNENPVARFILSPDNKVCLGTPFCFIDSSTSTGAPISNWLWEVTGDLIPDYTTPNICHTYALSGNYFITLTITDTIGCIDTARIAVTVNQPPLADFNADTTCMNAPMQFTDRSSPGSGVITSWDWSFYGPSPTGDFVQNPIKVYTDSGGKDVQLIVMDVNGCSDTAFKTVWVDWQTALIAYNDTSVCQGNSVTLHGTGGTYYIWTPSTFLDRTDSAYVVSTPSTSIAYTVTTLGPYRVCPPTSQVITIKVLPPMPLDVTATPQRILLGATSQLTAYPAGRIDSILWFPSATLDCYDCIEPVAQPAATTTYTAIIYYSMVNAYCTSEDSVTVFVYNECGKENMYIPNTFTPNSDGKNDAFYPRGYGLMDITIFRIFDRWGNLLYEAKNIKPNDKNTAWYGTDKSGKNVDTGVYVYYMEGYCTNNEKVTLTGNVSLLR